MENVIKGVKVNGTSYGIDYSSLKNRPVYKDITMWDYLLEETQLEFAVPVNPRTGEPAAPFATAELDISPEFDAGDTFILTVDGEEYEVTAQVMQPTSDVTIYIIADASAETGAQWSVNQDGTQGGFIVPETMTGTHTVSIQRYTKDVKTLDREFLGLFNLADELVTKIEKDLGLTDFVGSVFNIEDSVCVLVTQASRLENGFISIVNLDFEEPYTYNPTSGYLLATGSAGITFDVSETLDDIDSYKDSAFQGLALVYGEGEPVIIYQASKNDSIWNLTAAEQYLRDADGNIVHDFSEGAIGLDTSTGEWTLNGSSSLVDTESKA